MNILKDKVFTEADNLEKQVKIAAAFYVGAIVIRCAMKKAGIVPSFWYGLPKKPGTYSKGDK